MWIKICGVKDPEVAAFAARSGAHFIGFIVSPGFERSVTLEQAKEIADAALQAGAKPVAVFVQATSEEIEKTCRCIGVDVVQAYQLTTPLSSEFKRFYVNDPNPLLRLGHDVLLVDTTKPHFSVSISVPPEKKPWFFAGGLTPQNVKATIERLRPDGVDVSSGVEENGRKCLALIQKFIEEVKSCE